MIAARGEKLFPHVFSDSAPAIALYHRMGPRIPPPSVCDGFGQPIVIGRARVAIVGVIGLRRGYEAMLPM